MGVRAVSFSKTANLSSFVFEPRARLAYKLSKTLSLNAGFEVHHQFTHELYLNGLILPNKIWVLTSLDDNASVSTPRSRQVYLGVSGLSSDKAVEWFVELYDRRMDNLFRTTTEGVGNFSSLLNWQESVIKNGNGRSRGGELYLKVTRPTGHYMFAYTASFSDRSYAEINEGRPFSYSFNRRHSFNFNWHRQMNESTSLNFHFVFKSGQPTSLPIGRIGNGDLIYGDFNNTRLPVYHRLDFSLSKKWYGGKKNKAKRTLDFTIFNMYNRKNPFYLEYRRREVISEAGVPTIQLQPVQISLFPIIPGISYSRWL